MLGKSANQLLLALVAATVWLTITPPGARAASCPVPASTYSDAVSATSGLVAYHRLADASGVAACDSAGANPGAYSGGYRLGEAGPAGTAGAVYLDGSSGRVRIPSSSALNPTSRLTLEAWVKPGSVTTSQTVARKDGQYLLRIADGRVFFRLWATWSAYTELAAPVVLRPSSWQHLAATYDGVTMRLYVDGALVASRARSGGIQATGNSLYLGASTGSYDFFGGSLGDVATYATALSADTVARHRSLAVSAPAPTPVPTATATATATPSATPTPVVTPTPDAPASAGFACGLGTFTVGNWPSRCWRPYADSSPFNRRVPAAPRLAANSAQVVQRVLGFGAIQNLVAGESGTADDWSHPTYYPGANDPYFTLHCTEPWGTCAIEGHRIRIPDAARAAAGGDAHLTVVDQSTGWEYDLYDVSAKPAGGGRLDFGWGGRTRIDGDGRGSDATAAQFGNLAGIIRAQELAAGVIPHALFTVIKCGSTSPRFVYPATKGGTYCSDTTSAPPMGSHLWLAMTDEQIEALAVPRWKKTVLHAMADYGMIMGDTGSGSWAIQAESGSTYTSFGYEDELVKFARANGWSAYNGRYSGNLRDGVDWARYLRVLDPCVSQGAC
jgi:hypothetical protein